MRHRVAPSERAAITCEGIDLTAWGARRDLPARAVLAFAALLVSLLVAMELAGLRRVPAIR